MALRVRDLSTRTKLCVTGRDRLRFLNGQTTNDVRKAGADSTQESCVLDSKGHLEAHLFLFTTSDAVWIDADEELSESLPARLERYIIADDVTIENVTDQFALFHVLASDAIEIAEAKFAVRSHRLLPSGCDFWVPCQDSKKVRSALVQTNEILDESEWEVLRQESGVPRWGRELSKEVIPPEANLDLRAIDYNKGCYIGQEVISRMKMSGQKRQRLCGLASLSKPALPAGATLFSGEKIVGKVTSTAFSERMNAHIALAMIKRGFNDAGSELSAVDENSRVPVRVVTLPFCETRL